MEFAGIDRTPRQSNHNDPGSSFLNIGYLKPGTYRPAGNLSNVVGVPVTTPAGRQLLVRDPSGFLVLLMEKS